MNYGVVLPIWQLTIAEADALAVRAEELGLDGVFVPDHILAKPATTQRRARGVSGVGRGDRGRIRHRSRKALGMIG